MQKEKYNKKRGKIGWLFPAVGVPILLSRSPTKEARETLV
jgi:hypothetical protein